jgi:hypothetical protein
MAEVLEFRLFHRIQIMKNKILTIVAIVLVSSCCQNKVIATSPIVEKITSQSQGGSTIYYNLLLEDGTEIRVSSWVYAHSKVGDNYPISDCGF